MPGNAAEALGERLSVAVSAARADLVAARDGVPGGLCPLDWARLCHKSWPQRSTSFPALVARVLGALPPLQPPTRATLRGGLELVPPVAQVTPLFLPDYESILLTNEILRVYHLGT